MCLLTRADVRTTDAGVDRRRRTRNLTRNGISALAVAVLAFALLAVISYQDGPRADFWRIAIPGLLTGIGTLILAGVTVWLSMRERQQELQAREEQSIREEQYRAEQRAAERQREFAEALRDARKVFGYAGGSSGPPSETEMSYIYVKNVSPDPIFSVAMTCETRNPIAGGELVWHHGVHQEGVAYLVPDGEHSFGGSWHDRSQDDGNSWLTYWSYATLPITVIWTDGRGNRWVRVGYAEPTPNGGIRDASKS